MRRFLEVLPCWGPQELEMHSVGHDEAPAPGEPPPLEGRDHPRVLVRRTTEWVLRDVDVDGRPPRMVRDRLAGYVRDDPGHVAPSVVTPVDQPRQSFGRDLPERVAEQRHDGLVAGHVPQD